jgi:two-component sensor histidine kinase
MTVSDDGCGLPPAEHGSGRQGLELVRGLAAHLGGQLVLEESGGLTARVSIPRDPGPQPH